MLRLLAPIVALFALIAIMVALDRPSPRADLTFINRGDVSTLDPAIISWQQDNRVARIISEGLTRNDIFTDNYEIQPAAAESWVVSPDGRTYTFTLREDARWSNAQPVRASDFVYSWRRSMLPDLAGDYIKLYELIEGASGFIQWRTEALAEYARITSLQGPSEERAGALWERTLREFDARVQLKALDDRTLRVTLVRPTSYFLDLTGFPPLYPVYPPLVRAHESVDPSTGMLRSRPDWTKPPLCVTNGPFRLVRWRFKRDMRFEVNEHYWNRHALNIRSIMIPSIQDPNTSVLAFRTGAVDWVSDVVPSYRDQMLRDKLAFREEHRERVESMRREGLDEIEIDRRLPPDPRNTVHSFPAFGTYFYNINCLPRLRDGRENPLADSRVRRALALAIDKRAIVEDIRRAGEPATGVLVPRATIAGYQSPAGLARDVERARALLAEAGYPDARGLPPLELLFNKDAGHDLIAQSIAKDWERELGLRVRLEQVEVKVFRERLKNADYMVSRAAWFGDYGDPTTFLNICKTGDGNNDRKFSSPAFDALLDRAEEALDPRERMNLLSQAERLLVEEEVPLIPLFQYVQLYLFDATRLTGISSHPRMEQQLFRADILGDGYGADRPLIMRRGDPAKGTFRLESGSN